MEKKELMKKLLAAKKEIGTVQKDSTNPFFKSKYMDINSLLEHVEPILQKHGLLLLQPCDGNFVCSEIIDVETGEDVSSMLKLPELTDPQKMGSAITYYRRYTLKSLLGIQEEDDDGNKASQPKAKSQPTKPPLRVGSNAWNQAIEREIPVEQLYNHYNVSEATKEKYVAELLNKNS